MTRPLLHPTSSIQMPAGMNCGNLW